VDCVILSRTVEDDPVVEILSRRNIPFATIGSLPEADRGKAVVETDHDQVGGCRAFSKAFIQAGSGKIAILGNDMNYIVNQSRLQGVRQAVASLRLPAENVYIRHNIDSPTACAEATDELIALGVRRFIAMDDEICANMLLHLHQRGMTIPAEIQVGTLIDSERLSPLMPAVPALKFDAAELGRVACRELLHYLRGEDFVRDPTLGYRILMR
jgi:DNA-binding LacI/PurR family transcriptional regulator